MTKEKIDWLEREGNRLLDNMLAVFLAADSRAMAAFGTCTAIATAGFGIALGFGEYVFGLTLGTGFYLSAIFALMNARSRRASYGGFKPAEYLEEVRATGHEYTDLELREYALRTIDEVYEGGQALAKRRKRWMDASFYCAIATPFIALALALGCRVLGLGA